MQPTSQRFVQGADAGARVDQQSNRLVVDLGIDRDQIPDPHRDVGETGVAQHCFKARRFAFRKSTSTQVDLVPVAIDQTEIPKKEIQSKDPVKFEFNEIHVQLLDHGGLIKELGTVDGQFIHERD